MSSTDAQTLVEHPATARLLRIGQRLRRWDAEHAWIVDTILVLVLFAGFGAPDLFGHPAGPTTLAVTPLPAWQMLLWQAGLLIPLWWRRSAPLLCLYCISVVVIGMLAFNIILRADATLLVALYSLARYGSLRHIGWALPPLIAAFVLVLTRLAGPLSISDLIFIAVSNAVGACALGFAIRLRRAQLVALRERAIQLEIERDQRSQLAAAHERTRVAREMHDIIGHSLSVIITLADGGAYAATAAPARSQEALHLVADTARRSLAELRRILGVLREDTDGPNLRPQPGIAEIEPLCRHIRAAGPVIDYHSSGDLQHLDLGVQLAAYRIVQEALTNVLKHAGPQTHVTLALHIDQTRLRILVQDTGPPHPLDRPPHGAEPGHGLIGMHERAALYGGTVTAGATIDGGWRVDADLELTPPRSEGHPA